MTLKSIVFHGNTHYLKDADYAVWAALDDDKQEEILQAVHDSEDHKLDGSQPWLQARGWYAIKDFAAGADYWKLKRCE